MNITDEMVTAACVALYRGSGDLEPTNDEMRAALAAALAVQPAEPVALPPLPVGAADTFVRFPDNGDRHQYRLSDLLTAYARACAAAWGVTVADGGDRG